MTQGNFGELMREIRSLKATFKYYGPFKTMKSIMGLDSSQQRDQVPAIDWPFRKTGELFTWEEMAAKSEFVTLAILTITCSRRRVLL